MNKTITVLGTGLLIGLLGINSSVWATNGYSPTGFGTTNKGIVGAGVALPQDTLTAATNPAGVFFLGRRIDVSLAFFNPNRGFTANDDIAPLPTPNVTPGSYESDNDLFLIPSFGWSQPIDENSAVGVSIGGNGGMNTEYDEAIWRNFAAPPGTPQNPDGFFTATEPTGVDFAQLFIGATYSRKLSDQHTVGIMPIFAIQRFKADGLEPFRQFSMDPNKVTDNGYDYSYGFGARIGWLGKFNEQFSVGASYQSKLYMQEFDDYAGLFAEQGGFDIPATVTLGLAYQFTPAVTLVFDYQRIFYGDVKSLGNSNDVNVRTAPLGSDDGLGFGWQDQNVYKIGLQWDYDPKWTFRAGYSHADQLFDNGEALFNVLAPATVRDHASFGFTHRFDKRSELIFSYTHAFNEEISGQNPLFTGSQTGFVEMDQNEIEIGWGYRF